MSAVESYDQQRISYAKMVSPYVIKILDEFGKQKWGMAGCLFRGRSYKMYTINHDTGRVPHWIIVHNIGKLSNETEAYASSYKYPAYKITLDINDKILSGPGDSKFVIYCGGYEAEKVYTDTIMTEVSEIALKQGLDKVLTNGYGPSPIYGYEMVSKEWGQKAKRVL